MCVSHYAPATDHFFPRFPLLPQQVWPFLSSMPHSHSHSYSHLHSLTPTSTPTPKLLHAPRSTLLQRSCALWSLGRVATRPLHSALRCTRGDG